MLYQNIMMLSNEHTRIKTNLEMIYIIINIIYFFIYCITVINILLTVHITLYIII